MGLTGWGFIAVLIVLTIGALAASIVVLPRLSGAGVRPAVARAGVLLSFAVLCLLTATAALNDAFGFFGSWNDLSGAVFSEPLPSQTVQAGGSAGSASSSAAVDAATAAPAVARGSSAVVPPGGIENPGERALTFHVTGAHSGLTGDVVVVLPAGYSDPANASRTYPVIEAFHGYPGHPEQWVYGMRLDLSLNAAAAKGVLGPAIIIAPALDFPQGTDTECVDGPGSAPKVETWVTEDVPNWAVQNFRARTDRSSWATLGLSAGGWCASMSAMLHPDRYGAALVLGGYFRPQYSDNYRPFGPTDLAAARYDLVELARSAPPSVAIWMETSKEDDVSYPSSTEFLSAVRVPMSVSADVLERGGHRFSVWEDELPKALSWLGVNVPGFAPPTARPG